MANEKRVKFWTWHRPIEERTGTLIGKPVVKFGETRWRIKPDKPIVGFEGEIDRRPTNNIDNFYPRADQRSVGNDYCMEIVP